MKTRIILPAALALVAVAAIAAACGGGGGGNGGGAAIRTDRGLAVAALIQGADRASEGQGGDESDTGAEPGAPAGDVGAGVGAIQGLVFTIAGGRGVGTDIAPFPSLQDGSQTGVTVQGYGSATVEADSAILEFYFGSAVSEGGGIEPLPAPGRGESEPSSGGADTPTSPDSQPQQPAEPITEADLQPVVDAIVAAGVSRDDIVVSVQPSYGDPYYGGSATIRATVGNVDAVEAVVNAAREAASGLQNVSLQGSNVVYTASDCAALELAAMQAAVEDARERGQAFASALGVGLGSVVGASHYSYSPFGSPCDAGYGGVYPLEKGFARAAGSQTPEVQLVATVTITFAIQ